MVASDGLYYICTGGRFDRTGPQACLSPFRVNITALRFLQILTFKFELIIPFQSELIIISLAGIQTANLRHTKLMRYQLSCPAWICTSIFRKLIAMLLNFFLAGNTGSLGSKSRSRICQTNGVDIAPLTLGMVKQGPNTCRDKRYVSTFKAVEAGMCTYLHIPAHTTFKAVEAGTCTYLGQFTISKESRKISTPAGI